MIRRPAFSPLVLFSLTLLMSSAGLRAEVPADHAAQMKAGLRLFEEKVAPLLRENCLECHGGKQVKGDFDLATRELLLKSAAVDAAKPAESTLLKLIRHEEDPAMPKRKPKLPEADIAAIARWLELGKTAPAAKGAVTDGDRDYWAFRRLAEVTPPPACGSKWGRNAVDRFIHAGLKQAGLSPNPAADAATLRRRLWLDVAGLPVPEGEPLPQSEAEVDALMERLLASQAFGETWARHWLDLARYADTAGFQNDQDYPEAWRYRDFVISAFRENMPFDELVRWQIAGDRLAPQDSRAAIATGFLALGPYQSPVTVSELETARYDEVDDFLQTLGTGLLGLTIGCARCHDHKYDPLPAADYYALAACFTTTTRGLRDVQPRTAEAIAQARAWTDESARLAKELLAAEQKFGAKRKLEAFLKDPTSAGEFSSWLRGEGRNDLAEVVDAVRDGLLMEQVENTQQKALRSHFARWKDASYAALWQRVQAHEKARPADPPRMLVLSEEFAGFSERVYREIQGPDYFRVLFRLNRGDVKQKQAPASPGLLQALTRPDARPALWRDRVPPAPSFAPDTLLASPGIYEAQLSTALKLPGDPLQPDAAPAARDFGADRAALALWLTDVEHGAGPLLARVMVNRLWHWHFGRGLVATPSDFGLQGEPPSHPELLEWLAGELVRSGWNLRHIHRLILTSATWRQSSAHDAAKAAADPANRLLWHWRPRRLTAEAIRDSLLAVSGVLDAQAGGPPERQRDHRRRAIYGLVKRSEPDPLLAAFDAPEPLEGTGQRPVSTVSPQALQMLNGAFFHQRAADLAARLRGGGKADDPAALVTRAYRLVLGREARATEREQALAYLRQQPGPEGLESFCRVLLRLNELVYLN
jgi:mono/diheme cytochrome c family protein